MKRAAAQRVVTPWLGAGGRETEVRGQPFFLPTFYSVSYLLSPRKTEGREPEVMVSVEVSLLGHGAGEKECRMGGLRV